MATIVHPVFEREGWTYYGEADPPSVKRLEETIRRLIAEVPIDDGHTMIETGRIRVQRDVYDGYPEYGVFLRLDQ